MSFFRTYIDTEVQKELFRRIEGVNKSYVGSVLKPVGDPFENEYFKTCWARVITIDGTGNPYYLNSQLGSNGKKPITEPLNIKNGNYSRGRAGITSISSNFKEFFLKQSTISFLCPDPKDFEEIQEKFLKHGRYVLVEFGWSTRKNIELAEITTNNLVKFSENLNFRTKNSRGNYAAICGVITNFSFNQKQDGSYEGTFEVSSMGRNILGQKIKTDGKLENLVNFIDERVEDIEDGATTTKEELKKLGLFREAFVNFHATIKALPEVIQDYVDNEHNNDKIEITNTKTEARGYGSHGTPESSIPAIKSKLGAAYIPNTMKLNLKTTDKKPLAYCTWGWFEDYILNSFFAFTSNSGTEATKFKTNFFSTNDVAYNAKGISTGNQSTLCKSNPNLFSLGLQSIILPGKFKQFSPDATAEDGSKIQQFQLEKERALSAIIKHFAEHFQPFEVGYTTQTMTVGQENVSNYTTSQNGENLESIENENFYPIQVGVKGSTPPNHGMGQIRNMVFEANYLLEAFDNAINIDEALIKFWQKVSNDYGGFWRFGVVQDENTDGKIKIEDLNIGLEDDSNILKTEDNAGKLSTKQEPNKIFKFPLYEKNSIIQDFSLETAYDSEMATMAVFGSNADMQATRGDMGQGYTELAIRALSLVQNKSLEKSKGEESYDDFLKNLQIPTNSNPYQQGTSSTGTGTSLTKQETKGGIKFTEITAIKKNREQTEQEIEQRGLYSDDEKDLRKGYFWFDIADNQTQIYSAKTGEILNEFKRTMLYKINKSADPDDASNYNVVLPTVPLQLSLTIQGIGGIKIGDLFYVDYLPEMYKKYCHWMVVGVDHEISTTGWTTKLDSRMIVDIPKLIENDSKSKNPVFTKVEFKPFVVPTGKQLRNKIKSIQELYAPKKDADGVTNTSKNYITDSETKNPYKMINLSIGVLNDNAEITSTQEILDTLKNSSYYQSILSGEEKKLVDVLTISDINNVINGNPLGKPQDQQPNIQTEGYVG